MQQIQFTQTTKIDSSGKERPNDQGKFLKGVLSSQSIDIIMASQRKTPSAEYRAYINQQLDYCKTDHNDDEQFFWYS